MIIDVTPIDQSTPVGIVPLGPRGFAGWTPVLAIVEDDSAEPSRHVHQVVDWIGVGPSKPETGLYVGVSGLVEEIVDAINLSPTDYYTQEQIDGALGAKADADALATVATSGSYDDLAGKPPLGTAAAADAEEFASAAAGALAVTSLQPYDTRATLNELSSIEVPAEATSLRVSGYAAPGDGGAAELTKVDEEPAYAGVQTANGFWYKNTSREFTPEMFTGPDRVRDWLEAAAYEKRKAVALAGHTYMVGDQVLVETDRDIDIELRNGVVLKGEAGAGNVLRFVNSGGARPNFRLTGQGIIDNSLRTYEPGVDSGTGLVLIRMGHLDISGVIFRGELGYGDSAIAAQECGSGEIRGIGVYGQSDIGIYLTGGGSTGDTDDWGGIKVIGSAFENCEIAVTARRQIGRVALIGNSAKNCGAGFQCAEASSGGTTIGFGRSIVIVGNIGENIGGAFVDARLADGAIITSNVVTDWGVVSTASSAYALLGCVNSLVKSNTAMLKGITATSQTGFSINDYTPPDSSTVQAENNTVEGNYTRGSYYGYRDISSGNNQFGPNRAEDVNTPYAGVSALNLVHRTASGFGFGTANPQAPLHVAGVARVERSGVPAQYVEVYGSSGNGEITSYSATTAAKGLRIRATTDASHTEPSSGSVSIQFDVLGALGLQIGQSRQVYVPGIGTTASAGNAFLDSGSTPANQLLRSTSSARYKTDIEDLDVDRAVEIYKALRAIWYRSTAERDRPDWSWYGLLAEEVAEIDPRLVQWGYLDSDYHDVERCEDGKKWTERVLNDGAVMVPDGVMYDRVALVCLMAERHLSHQRDQRLTQIEERLASLETMS